MTGGAPFTWRCRRCGNCCARPDGYVAFTPAEAARAATALGLSPEAFASRYLGARLADGRRRLRDAPGPACALLAPGVPARCRIYSARPAACRTFPQWPALLAGGEDLREAARWCPGLTVAPGDAP